MLCVVLPAEQNFIHIKCNKNYQSGKITTPTKMTKRPELNRPCYGWWPRQRRLNREYLFYFAISPIQPPGSRFLCISQDNWGYAASYTLNRQTQLFVRISFIHPSLTSTQARYRQSRWGLISFPIITRQQSDFYFCVNILSAGSNEQREVLHKFFVSFVPPPYFS